MTKIAILSDIHGNIDALHAVLADARQQGAEHLFVCGDITGYYYDTAAVWDEILSWNVTMCRGNHETIFSQWINGTPAQQEAIRIKYGSSYRIAAETMNKDDIDKLLSLSHPVSIQGDDVNFLLSHGAPWNENVYIYADMKDEDRKNIESYSKEYDVVMMGHTHYQFSHENNKFLALNPGSVGQPRSGKEAGASQARAQWALYNTQNRKHSLMTSTYDPSRIFEQADRYDPHLPYLKSVLTRQEAA